MWLAQGAVGVSQLLNVCSAGLFRWSGDVYRQTQFVQRRHARWVVGLAAYFMVAPLLFGEAAVVLPGYLLAAAILGAPGAIYAAVLLERRMIGAGLIAFVLFGLAVSNITTAFVGSSSAGEQFSYVIFFVNVVLYTSGAFGRAPPDLRRHIGRFKQVNDTLGHNAGDEVLRYVARFLKRHIREADYIFRWGGDDFLVMITCTANWPGARRRG